MLTAADDGFHPVTDPDPLWTETSWWGFTVPERSLGGMLYTLFRPNLGVASLVVQMWDADAVEPWRAPYARLFWHLPMPDTDLTKCEVGGLSIERLDPLTVYRLAYHDGDLVALDLEYRALAPPHEVPVGGGRGHFDQACHVTGTLTIAGEAIAVDAPALRDRSWYVRQDQRTLRAGYTYAIADNGEQLVVHSRAVDVDTDETVVLGGYLTRDGIEADLVSGARRVESRRRGHPDRLSIEATDAQGRAVVSTGTTFASLASQSTPGMFAWMSMCEWSLDGRAAYGEDHDVWSPDLLARAAARPASR
ncbi:MAG: DUF7064 domain-containing protein [Acidimicrobiales bacterium]